MTDDRTTGGSLVPFGPFACPVCDALVLDHPPYQLWPPPPGLVLAPPYGRVLGAPSYEVCASCGFEFGNDDDPGNGAEGTSFGAHRREWEAAGRPSFAANQRPRRRLRPR